MTWLKPFSISGWADAIQSMRTRSPNDSLTSRARLRLELSAAFDAVYGFVSADAEKNWRIDSETGVDLHEAWLECAAGRWDLRLGRQIVIWGKADGVQITDVISPPDYTESITRDLDVAASVFYTWDDYPAYHRTTRSRGDDLFVDYAPRHHRLTVLGLEFSRPWSDFVFRGEAAYYIGKYLETDTIAMDPIKRDKLKWLGGVDWTSGNDWTVIGQLAGDFIMNYDSRLADDAHELIATLSVSKQLMRQTLTLSNMLYYDLNENEIYVRPKADYALTDDFHLLVGADVFCGEDGDFGRYRNNSQVWVKAKYSF